MRTTFISTLTLLNSPRNVTAKLQAELAKANEEITTGRHADVGLTLGYRTGQSITLRQERAELDAITDSNALTSIRLSATNMALDDIRETADKFLSTLISVPNHPNGASIIKETAASNLSNLIAQLNQSANGQYIFAGTDTKQKPVAEYRDASAPKVAVSNAYTAFKTASGVTSTADITPAQMQTFLDGDFATLFSAANWKGTWSSAGDRNIDSRISTTERIETSTNANEAAMRQLAMAYTMASDLGIDDMNEQTQKVVINKLIQVMGAATAGIVEIQTKLGIAESKISEANERMGLQKLYLDEGIGKLEAVDPAEAKSRVDALTTQIQMSYSLTSQLRQLSLLNYL